MARQQLKVYELNVIYRFESTDDVMAMLQEHIRLNYDTQLLVMGHRPVGSNYRCLGHYTRTYTWVPADGTPDPGLLVAPGE